MDKVVKETINKWFYVKYIKVELLILAVNMQKTNWYTLNQRKDKTTHIDATNTLL